MSKDSRPNKTAWILGAGEQTDRGLHEPHDLLIAADGGLVFAQAHELQPDLIVGDFDSLGYLPSGKEVVTLPVQKDETDMAAACALAVARGCSRLRLYGGSGSRQDHFLANLQLMAYWSAQGVAMELFAPAFSLFALTDGKLRLTGLSGQTFSVFSHSARSEGVSIAGACAYPLAEHTLINTCALGVSNAFTGAEIEVSVAHGTLLIYREESCIS